MAEASELAHKALCLNASRLASVVHCSERRYVDRHENSAWASAHTQPLPMACLNRSEHVTPKGCAAPGQVLCQCNTRGLPSKLKRAPPQAKINVTNKSPVGDISVVTLIRTDTTLDHSQKAEKV